MIKKALAVIFVLLSTLFIIKPAYADSDKVSLHLFWYEGCPHCAKEKIFLQKLEKKYPYLKVYKYEPEKDVIADQIFTKVLEELGLYSESYPLTVIGSQYLVGYGSDEIEGKAIEQTILEVKESGSEDLVQKIVNDQKAQKKKEELRSIKIDAISVPFIGKVDVKTLSLPVLTIVIAALDGFNPCAMWTLLFLISLLLGMKDRKKMWILGTAFIFTSAFVYFLFLAAWLNVFISLKSVTQIQTFIGLFAMGAGVYYLREYYVNKDGVCKVTGNKKRQKVFEKIRHIAKNKHLAIALIGIIILAFAVNLVELMCSAGLPAIYTHVLSMSNLPMWQYYLYLIMYILIFMLDDLLIFFTAMITLQTVGMEGKYARFSHLIGGILMLIVGILLLFKPGLLMFG